ncbi:MULTISPECIES: biopolymer transporter ExbD [unclassified Vibrio]|uniref:ExbD/TolR family protein n=1 Tax=Vibrio sp. HB236076 TaxID=3232307 RepID=A0AB39HK81_9VIBR|nr:biopolymer transporter ExbD [Vibrio sp. HB161653]MDP5252950.1 biopolymer transporter ExbD [Vibrio sp. HB161653]
MRLGRQSSTSDEATIDLTPMLDIVFIMLIFFIVTSSFVNESGVEVNRPSASHATSQKGASIMVAVTANDEIYVNKREVDPERLQASIEQLITDKETAAVVIQGDELAQNGTIVKVIDAAKGAGIQRISLATETQ